jgi:hypothetical protein
MQRTRGYSEYDAELLKQLKKTVKNVRSNGISTTYVELKNLLGAERVSGRLGKSSTPLVKVNRKSI